MVAARAERVLEALYQDAVRQRIDDVYGAFVTALAARQTVRYAKRSADRLVDVTERNEQRFKKGDISLADLNQVRIRLRTARLGLVDAEAAYRKAKLDLGSLMNLKLEEIARLELKGTINDVAPLLLRRWKSCGNSPWPNGPTSCRSGWESTGPKPTSGWPRPTHTAMSMFSGSRIRFRTTRHTA